MVRKIGDAEVTVVGVRVTLGVKLPLDLVIQKDTVSGCKEPEYRIVYMGQDGESVGMSDEHIGRVVRASVLLVLKKYERADRQSELELD